ncbi:Na+/H+ antiporter [Peribacillus sp. B-H-3]|uniref:Na+/H+ antiporter n=1 Tax=Peribacillus sp. B-H-3 TaxID=3400420 RepID=UPI003B0191C5
METFLAVLILLALIGLSNFINHFIPIIPVPLIQIALGGMLAVLPAGIHLPLNPELFFVLFIAPLLFYDGKNVPRADLWKLRSPILLLALGLVFLTVIVMGYIIYWLIPSIPLPAAFALAAILSPTDAVAVSAISERVKMPKIIMRILEGEALMNDASGLVAFKFAVAATVTGVFSIAEATFSFFIIAIGGLVIGAVLAFLILRLRTFIRRLGMEDVTIHMLIHILTPFIIYLVTEEIGVSGILGVVAAGIVHAIERDRDESPTVKLQVVSVSTWTVLSFILNGLVFMLLGVQVPHVLKVIISDPAFNNMKVFSYVAIITLLLIALRFIWVTVIILISPKLNIHMPGMGMKSALTLSFAGVRGAVTLAGAFSIPFVLENGSKFPQRELFIFISAGVILLTLILSSIALPILGKQKEDPSSSDASKKENQAKVNIYKEVIQFIKFFENEENRVAVSSVVSKYTRAVEEINYSGVPKNPFHSREMEADIRLSGLHAEEELVRKLAKTEEIKKELAYQFLQNIHYKESAVTSRLKYRLLITVVLSKRLLHKLFSRNRSFTDWGQEYLGNARKLKVRTSRAAIGAIKKGITEENKEFSLLVIAEYRTLIARLNHAYLNQKTNEDLSNIERELHYKAIQAERDQVQSLFEHGEITRELSHKIRQQINIREAALIDENSYE